MIRFKSMMGFSLMFLSMMVIFNASNARAVTRPIFQPGDVKALILMQGLSMGQSDPDPRRLYDLMALAPTDVPAGGQGKGVKTADGAFTLSCVARPALPEDVMCSIVVKPSARTEVSSREQRAEVVITDSEATSLYNDLAGPGSAAPFTFVSADGWTSIEATPQKFHFLFKKSR